MAWLLPGVFLQHLTFPSHMASDPLGNCIKGIGSLQLAFSPHQCLITLSLYSVCSLNDFFSCCSSFCNIKGKGVCAGKGICGHKLRRLYKLVGESQLQCRQ